MLPATPSHAKWAPLSTSEGLTEEGREQDDHVGFLHLVRLFTPKPVALAGVCQGVGGSRSLST